jgi:hypothetical protein
VGKQINLSNLLNFKAMTKQESTRTPILAHLQDMAIQSYYWTSFSPEKRGEQLIKDYSEELEGDIEELKLAGIIEEIINEYTARYERFFSAYIVAKSRTFSAMITGPANFNTRRHAKANRSEEKHYEVFREWRERAKKSIIRKSLPEKTYCSELVRYRSELDSMKKNHERMKEANKRIKQANKTGEDLTAFLTGTMGVAAHMIEWTMKFGFGLQNNNANIKRVEQRIKELETKEAARSEGAERSFSFDGGEIILNYEIDRIQIFFNKRPTQDELNTWKSKGLSSFNWSPSNNAWQRKITANALWSTKRMFGIAVLK